MRVERKLREWSYFADWLWVRYGGERSDVSEAQGLAWAELISQRPSHATFMHGWDPAEYRIGGFVPLLLEEVPPPVFREALDMTRFALEQFRERTERDGAALVVLASHGLRGEGDALFELLRGLAASVGVPVISQYDHIIAAGGRIEDARWAHDFHWNATGHRWAAETILEWLKENAEVCG